MKRSEILKAALTLLNPTKVAGSRETSTIQPLNYLCHCVSLVNLGLGDGEGYKAKRAEIRKVINERINQNVSFDVYSEEKLGFRLDDTALQTARRTLAEELIAKFEKEENKVSVLLIEAKKLLDTGSGTGWVFICHAIAEAAGVDYKGDKTGYMPAAKQATEAVELIVGTGNEHKDDTATYRKFHNVLTGDEPMYGQRYQDAMQAGRHRLLDYLIAEFQAVGN